MPLPVKEVRALGGWGKYPLHPAKCARPEKTADFRPVEGLQIARGLGRSYGDAAVCAEGTTLLTERMNRFLSFDQATGILTAESGATLAEILTTFVPRGWFVPVTPGTKFCSLGGCLAADVHGKNHHVDGSFSQHVTQAVLLDASGRKRVVSPDRDPDVFWATAGGMGLTGLVTEVSLRLMPIQTSYIQVTHRRAQNLDQVVDMLADPSLDDRYSVAWIDCLASGDKLGRSILMTGHHVDRVDLPVTIKDPLATWSQGRLAVPFTFPGFALNKFSVKAFNAFYNLMQGRKTVFYSHFDKFFYPLDGIQNWNRIYGKKGFVQYQVALPFSTGKDGLRRLLEGFSSRGYGSFLAVLKKFGPGGSGLLSFPFEGYTLALDIPLKPGLLEFLDEMDKVVLDCGGREYLAKDSRMKPDSLHSMYPRLQEFREICFSVDPTGVFRSDLSKRLEVLP